MVSRHGLGRGLGALLPPAPSPATESVAPDIDRGVVQELPVDAIHAEGSRRGNG